MDFDHEKATQALNLLAKFGGGEINKMKAIKLIWLSDRFHLRKYGRPIMNDIYLAMAYGPVASSVKDIAELSDFLSENEKEYAQKYLSLSGEYDIKSNREPDDSVFSETEVEVLTFIYKNFEKQNQFDLVNYSHNYPEWKKHKDALETSSRVAMNYNDFFEDPVDVKEDIFVEKPEVLQMAKEEFSENVQVSKIWE